MVCRAVSIGFAFAIGCLAQSAPVSGTRLVVEVRPEAALAWQGDSAVVVKVRLALGTQARVWAGESCGATPADAVQTITASGIYTIPLTTIDGPGKPAVCLSSSDARLNVILTK